MIQIDGVVLNGLENLDVEHAVGWDLMIAHRLGAAEILSLKELEAGSPGGSVFFLRFDICGNGAGRNVAQKRAQEPSIVGVWRY